MNETTQMPRRHGKAADIDPADYRHFGDYYKGTSPEWEAVYAADHARLEAVLSTFGLIGDIGLGTKCEHCGARYNHGSVYHYLPGDELVFVGQICSANTFGMASREALAKDRLARAYAAEKERIKAAEAAEAWAASNADVHAHLLAFSDNVDFYRDLLAKLHRYGYLTERQTEAVRRGIQRDHQRRAEAESREAQKANLIAMGVEAPEGEQEIAGTVLSVKIHSNAYGDRLVMTVKDTREFRVWGTVPRALSDVQPGDTVTFTADITQSDTDPLFGFFKRPRRAAITGTTRDVSDQMSHA